MSDFFEQKRVHLIAESYMGERAGKRVAYEAFAKLGSGVEPSEPLVYEREPNVTVDRILDCPMGENDAEAETMRDYLKALLLILWRETDQFSGKRPFGNSRWEHEIYKALLSQGLIEGELVDGYVEEVDETTGYLFVKAAIEALQ